MNKYQDNTFDYLFDLSIEEMEQNEEPCEQRGFFYAIESRSQE